MKILFDHQLFSYQRYGGASKYFAMLLKHLPHEIWETTTIYSNNEFVKANDLFRTKHIFPNMFFKGQGWLMNTINKPYSLKILKAGNYDLFHQTYYDTYSLRAIGNKPMVTTFHDINFSTLNPKKRVENWQRMSLSRANKIITISHNTKKDLMNYFSIPEEKISVIYHGILKPTFFIPNERIIDAPYILYVGTRRNHKNFDRFVHAFAHIHEKYKDVHLICTFKPFQKDELEMFSSLGISDVVMQRSVTESQLYNLYQNALMFVFPSLYEGFGMPILEAWVNNCPVVLSNASCFPEIACDAGCYFDPNDAGDIAEKMQFVIDHPLYREELIMKGAERVKLFSWEKCAKEHIDVYKSLL